MDGGGSMHFLYIDPGTGSMLFYNFIGMIRAAILFASHAFMKVRFIISGGKKAEANKNKIPFVIFLIINDTGMFLTRFAGK